MLLAIFTAVSQLHSAASINIDSCFLVTQAHFWVMKLLNGIHSKCKFRVTGEPQWTVRGLIKTVL